MFKKQDNKKYDGQFHYSIHYPVSHIENKFFTKLGCDSEERFCKEMQKLPRKNKNLSLIMVYLSVNEEAIKLINAKVDELNDNNAQCINGHVYINNKKVTDLENLLD